MLDEGERGVWIAALGADRAGFEAKRGLLRIETAIDRAADDDRLRKKGWTAPLRRDATHPLEP